MLRVHVYTHTHTQSYLLYRRNIRAYTAPPMHSGYRRYDRYFMAYRETCKTHYSTTIGPFALCTSSSMGQSLVFKWNKAHQRIVLLCPPLWLIRFSILFKENVEIATQVSESLWEKYSFSQLLHLLHVCLFFEPDTRFKAYLECWSAPFPGNLNLKGFLYFPYLENKTQNDRSAFHRMIVIYQ